MNKRKQIEMQEEPDESSRRKTKRKKNESSEYAYGKVRLKESCETANRTPAEQDDRNSTFIPAFRVYDIGKLDEITADLQDRTSEEIHGKTDTSEYANSKVTPAEQDDRNSTFIPAFRIYDIGKLDEITAALQDRTSEEIYGKTDTSEYANSKVTPAEKDDRNSTLIPAFRVYDIGQLDEITVAFQDRTSEEIRIEIHWKTNTSEYANSKVTPAEQDDRNGTLISAFRVRDEITSAFKDATTEEISIEKHEEVEKIFSTSVEREKDESSEYAYAEVGLEASGEPENLPPALRNKETHTGIPHFRVRDIHKEYEICAEIAIAGTVEEIVVRNYRTHLKIYPKSAEQERIILGALTDMGIEFNRPTTPLVRIAHYIINLLPITTKPGDIVRELKTLGIATSEVFQHRTRTKRCPFFMARVPKKQERVLLMIHELCGQQVLIARSDKSLVESLNKSLAKIGKTSLVKRAKKKKYSPPTSNTNDVRGLIYSVTLLVFQLLRRGLQRLKELRQRVNSFFHKLSSADSSHNMENTPSQ